MDYLDLYVDCEYHVLPTVSDNVFKLAAMEGRNGLGTIFGKSLLLHYSLLKVLWSCLVIEVELRLTHGGCGCNCDCQYFLVAMIMRLEMMSTWMDSSTAGIQSQWVSMHPVFSLSSRENVTNQN